MSVSKNALTVFNRLAARKPEQASLLEEALRGRLEHLAEVALDVAVETGDPMGQVLARQVEDQSSSALVVKIAKLCDTEKYVHSFVLWEVAQVSGQKALDHYGKIQEDLDSIEMGDVARLAANLSGRLLNLGRKEEALNRVNYAVSLFRLLAGKYPQNLDILKGFVGSLIALSNSLVALGLLPESIDASQEAIEIGRDLQFLKDDGSGLRLRAATLANLGFALNKLNRFDEALRLNQEAVELSRRMPHPLRDTYVSPPPLMRPNVFRPIVARLVLNLSSVFSKQGKLSRALMTIRKAVMLHWILVKHHSPGYTPVLAQAVSNMAGILHLLGRRDEALEEARRAAGIIQKFVSQEGSAAYDLGYCLYNLGLMQKSSGYFDEAISSVDAALSAFRGIANGGSFRVQPKIAKCLQEVASLHSLFGKYELALELSDEAVKIVRKLSAEHLRNFRGDLAEGLNNLGNRLADNGRNEEGRSAHEEAICIYRELAAEEPLAFQRRLAISLNNLGADFLSLDLMNEARDSFEEALELIAPFFVSRPASLAGTVSSMVASYRDTVKITGGRFNYQVLAPICGALERFMETSGREYDGGEKTAGVPG